MTPPSSAPDPAAAAPGSIVLGTAGHVDHGKSTLVQALTGIDPDRLAEEKARAMTIDLGFAWLTLPSGRVASIVDVPGHERFIKNMLAGVGGIDGALLVIAADEGPMPQTREHLAILDLLGNERGLVVITKTDLVDSDWLDLVTAEIHEQLAGSGLRNAPLVPVSARTGAGLDALLREVDRLAADLPSRAGGDRPRLPVDRVFTVAGFGTVVTGTLTGGDLCVGQELRLFPHELPVRVRGLQTHGAPVEQARPGSRVAINLAGLAVDQVRRGDVLAPASLLTPSRRLDARLRLLPDAPIRLEQNAAVDFFTGAADVPARLTLLDRDVLNPGDEGWVQLRFPRPVAVLKGDRFIVRRPSPSETIGGGEVVDANPPRHRRFEPVALTRLETLAAGTPAELLAAVIADRPWTMRELRASPPAGLTAAEVEQAVAELTAAGTLVRLARSRHRSTDDGFLVQADSLTNLLDSVMSIVSRYHHAHQLRPGMPREALRAELGLDPALFDDVLFHAATDGKVVQEQATIRLPTFTVSLTAEQHQGVAPFLVALEAQPYNPPSPASFGLDDEVTSALEHLDRVVRISAEVAVTPAAFAAMTERTLAIIDAEGSISLGRFRDEFQTSRKYAQAVLEHLDRRRITRRIGEDRIRFGPVATPRPSE